MRLILASRNPHKLDEIRLALSATVMNGEGVDAEGIDVASLDGVDGVPEELEETGVTFEENALQKARFVHQLTGDAVLADDSGIEIRALNWEPGVHSKRWSAQGTDAANNDRLMNQLHGVADRVARYRCALAVVAPGPDGPIEGVVVGEVTGMIGQLPRGVGGFGYDPLFWPDERQGQTMAELTTEDKNSISHRGRALAELPGLLRRLGLV